MRTWYRIHPAEEDPALLLDPEKQRSEPWAGTIFSRCDKCGGSGETIHECLSCRAGPARADCPVCAGEIHYNDQCPACEGSGEIDDSERDGISVFPEEDGLYHYMLRRGGDFDGAKLVVLEGEASSDEDFDADEGAVLIHPCRIVEVREPDRRRIGELRARPDRE